MSREHPPPSPLGPTQYAPGNDYLWDRSGPVDEQVAELERVLAPLAHRGRPPVFATSAAPRWKTFVLLAAILALVATVTVYFLSRPPPPPQPRRGPLSWTIASASGKFTQEAGSQTDATQSTDLGEWIETFGGASVRLAGTGGGAVLIGADSRVRVCDLGDSTQRVQLSRGSLFCEPSKAKAPVEVDTPAGLASVLPGTACEFEVTKEGRGTVHVKMGQVEIRKDGRSARLTSASSARIDPSGPGTPVDANASTLLRDVLGKFDSLANEDASDETRRRVLQKAIESCEASDVVTLWNLMGRTDEQGRRLVLARAQGVTKSVYKLDSARLIALDTAAMEQWWAMIAVP